MSYVANQYNYATPLSSVANLVSDLVSDTSPRDSLYFTLHSNDLRGRYFPISGDVGLWGTSLSDSSGVLATPFIITITETTDINAFRLRFSRYSYAVDFTVTFYNGSTALYTITETGNDNFITLPVYLPKTLKVTKYEIRITKISHSGRVARLYGVYNPGYVQRVDTLNVQMASSTAASSLHEFFNADTLSIKQSQDRNIVVSASATDSAPIVYSQDITRTHHIGSTDTLRGRTADASSIINTVQDARDTLSLKPVFNNHIHKTLGTYTDKLSLGVDEDTSHVTVTTDRKVDICPVGVSATTSKNLLNIHSVMKSPTRRIHGKVFITYTDPLLDTAMRFTSAGDAYNSALNQIMDSKRTSDGTFFTLYENDLTGKYHPSELHSQVGWTSKQLSDERGEFGGVVPYLRIDFSARPVLDLSITFDDSRGALPTDFTFQYVLSDGSIITKEVMSNSSATVQFNDSLQSVEAIVVTFRSLSKPFYPVTVLEIPAMATIEYVGYEDRSDIISIDLLEELTYDDEIEALGGMSANSITLTLDNSDRKFFFNNAESLIAKSLKRNRKIIPWLGAEVSPGSIEWYPLGTFWSYRWDVPVEGLTTKVVGFDTIGLLDMTRFTNHTTQINRSIGELIEYVLEDARAQLNFIEYDIDDSLYDIIIPYAWFEADSHTAALRRISQCYPMHIYCDRYGSIIAAPQMLRYNYYVDVWSDSTNVISKTYNSLHTTLPNVVSVEVKQPVEKLNEQIVDDTKPFIVNGTVTRVFNFNSPLLFETSISVSVIKSDTVSYTYKVYSWGIEFTFTGSGNVSSIRCAGTLLDISNTSAVTERNEDSVWQNGEVTRNISSDFIQTEEHARDLINRLLVLSEYDKYDVEVKYRGDISLTINDPILLLDGIAPDNRYNIKRHELSWNGYLTGSAYLNT